MIRVEPQPEPVDFDEKVRQKGLAFLSKNGINPNGPLPEDKELRDYWRSCLPQLQKSYQNICAYYSYYCPEAQTDHFIPKSKNTGQAYEWSNFRLCSTKANQRKGNSIDILDPFTLPDNCFFLRLASGEVYVNPKQPEELKRSAQRTLDRLQLNHPNLCEMRAGFFECIAITRDMTPSLLYKHAPFVYSEVQRQGLLTES